MGFERRDTTWQDRVLGDLLRIRDGLAWRLRHAQDVGRACLHSVIRRGFSSSRYWEDRYQIGGTSGAGSYGQLAHFKAEFVNAFVADNHIASVLDLGCGDGNFLSMLKLPAYVGVDVSSTTLARCAERFAALPNYNFILPDRLNEVAASELALSIDVIYHLVEDTVFEQHMARLFESTTRFIIIYASNINKSWPDQHVRHRRFGDHVAKRWPNWRLLAHVPNPYPYDPKRADTTSFADFFVYGRTGESCAIRLPSV